MSQWRWKSLGLTLVVMAAIAGLGMWSGMPRVVPNSAEYIQVAQGRAAEVAKPFSGRVLAPWLAGSLMRAGWSPEAAFSAVVTGALGLLGVAVWVAVGRLAGSAGDRTSSCWRWPALLFCPLLVQDYANAYMPDLPHAALLACLFVALVRAEGLVIPIVFVMQFCRESSVLSAFVVAASLVWMRRWWFAAGVAAASVGGMAVVGAITPASSVNIHHMSTGTYMLLKSVYSFAANWLGVRFWRPTFAWGCPAPLWSGSVPGLGTPVVVCDWHPEMIATTWGSFFGALGLSLGLFAAAWRAVWARRAERAWRMVLVIGVYGVLAGLIGTFTGTAVYRLVGYGWPLLWIVVPVLFGTVFGRARWGWLGLHWVLLWVWWPVSTGSAQWMVVYAAGMAGLNVWVWRRLRGVADEGGS